MVITMALKHLVKRGKIYYFRMLVPKDCIDAFGKREIVQSLQTGDPLEASTAAKKLAAAWKQKFEIRRSPVSDVPKKRAANPLVEDAEDFRRERLELMKKNLPGILQAEDEEALQHRLDFYEGCIFAVRTNGKVSHDLSEIGILLPLEPSKSPGFDRQRKKILCDVLKLMCEAVSEEMGLGAAENLPEETPKRAAAVKKAPETDSAHEQSITDVVELMIAAKKIPERIAVGLRADVKLLKEWCGGKDDLTSYTKRDLIDFMQNALPYIPVNMNKKKAYRRKPLRACVALTKSDPKTNEPISHRTCENRQAHLCAVFNYAKDHLGLITINPGKGIEVPKVRVSAKRVRGYLPQELTAMWAALQAVKENVSRKPARYWATVLSLYHGFRLNEVCSLFLKDVYEDEDGVFVIDINDEGALKSVKNISSVRIVPVHPFVRDQLGFRAFVAEQKSARSEGVLFTDVKGTEKNGYIRQTSFWFAGWKKEWLPSETQYKHFHDLRYTFTQTAQNVAKMPDRHAQEITGHSIEGVSAVHLAYSGRLKPVDLLPELEKVRYGWE